MTLIDDLSLILEQVSSIRFGGERRTRELCSIEVPRNARPGIMSAWHHHQGARCRSRRSRDRLLRPRPRRR